MKTGRKRKTNVRRDRSGKSRGEAHIVHPETVFVRERELESLGIDKKHALDQLAGFTLGLLRLRGRDSENKDPGGISQEQYEAGQSWARIVHRYMAINGMKGGIRTPSFLMVAGGMDTAPDPDERDILRVRRQFVDCYDALAHAAQSHGHRVQLVTWSVCIENIAVRFLTPACYGYLRVGLNALGKAV